MAGLGTSDGETEARGADGRGQGSRHLSGGWTVHREGTLTQSTSPSPSPSGAHSFRPSKSQQSQQSSVPAVWSSEVTHTQAPCPVILSPCLCPRSPLQTQASVSPPGPPVPGHASPSYPCLADPDCPPRPASTQPRAPGPGRALLSATPRVLTPQASRSPCSPPTAPLHTPPRNQASAQTPPRKGTRWALRKVRPPAKAQSQAARRLSPLGVLSRRAAAGSGEEGQSCHSPQSA